MKIEIGNVVCGRRPFAVATAKVDAQSTLIRGIERGWDVDLIIGDEIVFLASKSMIEKRLAIERYKGSGLIEKSLQIHRGRWSF